MSYVNEMIMLIGSVGSISHTKSMVIKITYLS